MVAKAHPTIPFSLSLLSQLYPFNLWSFSKRFQKAIEDLEEENHVERRKLLVNHKQRVLAR